LPAEGGHGQNHHCHQSGRVTRWERATVGLRCVKHQIELVGRIPYDTAVTHAMVAGKSIVEFSDGKVTNAIKEIWHKVEQILKD